MGDLISRKELLEVLTHCKELGRKSFASVIEVINDQPTISDKEIRDKAVEEFTNEAMKRFTEFDLKHGYPTVADCKMILREIAEDMKEVGE